MTNKQYIMDHLKKDGYIIGCYSDMIDQLSKRTINRLLEYVGDYTDIKVTCKSRKYMIELACVDNEIDFVAIEMDEYKRRYGKQF